MEKITSSQNPKIKMLLELQGKSRARRESGLFAVEGRREVGHCFQAGYKLKTLFICPEIFFANTGAFINEDMMTESNPDAFIATMVDSGCQILEVTPALYEKIAFRGTTEGIVAEVYVKPMTLDDLSFKLEERNDRAAWNENSGDNGVKVKADDDNAAPLVIVLESVEKPGNLGAVLRSADAAGADAVIVCDPLTDLYNPNLIRSSIGAIFTVPTVCCTTQDAIMWLKSRNFSILTAQLQDSSLYYHTDMKMATAIVMGTESSGLSDAWRDAATAHIRIPMLGCLDSLNVSVSAAILLFEAVRQRSGN